MIVRSKTTVATLVALLLAIISGSSQLNVYQQQQIQQPTVVNSSSPYWRRPGCYRVGHIRTISIPGCVKFNLSTNACRGYCMSYSVPNTMDLGPSSIDVETGSDDNDLGSATYDVPTTIKKDLGLKRNFETISIKEDETRPDAVIIVPDSSTNFGSKSNRLAVPNGELHFDKLAQIGRSMQIGRNSPVGHQHGASISGADKRDVVSVSQCCNMMETEEVVVNVRCGANEVRRLIFKSAKSCECFFCKHV